MASKRPPGKKSASKKSSKRSTKKSSKKAAKKSSRKAAATALRAIDKLPVEPGDTPPDVPGVKLPRPANPTPDCVFACAERFTENLASGLDIATCMRRLNRCIQRCLQGGGPGLATDLE